MSGKIRQLLNREGRYFTRLVVPKRLRPFLDDKTELRSVLCSDRRVALQRLPLAVAELQGQLTNAERAAAKAGMAANGSRSTGSWPGAQQHRRRRVRAAYRPRPAGELSNCAFTCQKSSKGFGLWARLSVQTETFNLLSATVSQQDYTDFAG